MNIQTEKTVSYIEQIAAQATLMNGLKQFSNEANSDAQRELERLVDFERLHGNKRLLEIYSNALDELRRRT